MFVVGGKGEVTASMTRGEVSFVHGGGVPLAVPRCFAFSADSQIRQYELPIVHIVEVAELIERRYEPSMPPQQVLCDALIPFHPDNVTTHFAGTTEHTPHVKGSVDSGPSLDALVDALGGTD